MGDNDDKKEEGKKVLNFPGVNPENFSENALERMIKMLPAMIAYFDIAAKLHMAKFLALKKEGFTDAQALELSKILF